MPLDVKKHPRIFKAKIDGKEVELEDPGIEMSPDEVLEFYGNTYTDLVTATVSGPKIKDDKAVYVFSSTVGTKG